MVVLALGLIVGLVVAVDLRSRGVGVPSDLGSRVGLIGCLVLAVLVLPESPPLAAVPGTGVLVLVAYREIARRRAKPTQDTTTRAATVS